MLRDENKGEYDYSTLYTCMNSSQIFQLHYFHDWIAFYCKYVLHGCFYLVISSLTMHNVSLLLAVENNIGIILQNNNFSSQVNTEILNQSKPHSNHKPFYFHEPFPSSQECLLG